MKTKIMFFKGINWMLAGIIGMLGFAGCKGDNSSYDKPMLVVYGPPPTVYTVKGAVINKTTGNPIPGIRIGENPKLWNEEKNLGVHVITNADGLFELGKYGPLPQNENKMTIYAEDIDGAENGLFKPERVEVSFIGCEYKNNKYTVTTTIKLTEIEVDE